MNRDPCVRLLISQEGQNTNRILTILQIHILIAAYLLTGIFPSLSYLTDFYL